MQGKEAVMAIYTGKFARFYSAIHHRREPEVYASTIVASNRLALLAALADNPSSAEELANIAKTELCCVREWLSDLAASGYLQRDAATQRYWMTEQQAYALADKAGNAFIKDAFATWRKAKLFGR
jgi:predicted ArsR family transcriptional regulator